jgi:hypothetical protein
MKSIRFIGLIALLATSFLFSNLCRAENNIKNTEFKLVKYSMLNEFLSFLKEGKKKHTQVESEIKVSEESVKEAINNFFQAIRNHQPDLALDCLSDSFYSGQYGGKYDYFTYLNTILKHTGTLSLNADINEIQLIDDRAVALINLNSIGVDLESGHIRKETDRKILAKLKKYKDGIKIDELFFEEIFPKDKIEGESFKDNWLFYQFKLPKNYYFVKSKYGEAVEEYFFRKIGDPLEMEISIHWLESGPKSAEQLLKLQMREIKKSKSSDIIKSGKHDFRGYDGGFVEYSFIEKGQKLFRRQLSLWRNPLIYVFVLTSLSQKDLGKGLNDYDALVRSFQYIDVSNPLRSHLVDITERPEKYIFKNNFYGFTVTTPPDWGFQDNQWDSLYYTKFKNKRVSALVHGRKLTNEVNLEKIIEDEQKIMKAAYKEYILDEKSKTTFNDSEAFKIRSRFNNGFFSSNSFIDKFMFIRSGILYEIAIFSKGENQAQRDENLNAFIKNVRFD